MGVYLVFLHVASVISLIHHTSENKTIILTNTLEKWKKELFEKTAAKSNLSGEYQRLRDETKKIEHIQRSVREILRGE